MIGVSLAAPAAASATPDNHLACELIPTSLVKGTLGVKHVHVESSATSPTAPAPYDHTVDGADESGCVYFGYNRKPSKAQLAGLRKIKKPVPAGLAGFSITTYVRDDGPNGEGAEWNPLQSTVPTLNKAMTGLRQMYGGAHFKAPRLGALVNNQIWIGNRDRPQGFYSVLGLDNGVLVLSVDTPSRALKIYRAFAKKIVPPFTGLIPASAEGG